MRDDELRGRHRRIHGAQPTAKAAPNLSGVIDGQMLQQALSDTAKRHVDVVGAQLAPNRSQIGLGLLVQILIATAATQRLHILHPEMIAISTDDQGYCI